MNATDSVPKCTRLIVTRIYADGTSVVHDIPQPEDVAHEFVDLDAEPDISSWGTVRPVLRPRKTGFRLTATLTTEARTSIIPVPEVA